MSRADVFAGLGMALTAWAVVAPVLAYRFGKVRGILEVRQQVTASRLAAMGVANPAVRDG